MPIARLGPSVLAKLTSGGGANFSIPNAWIRTAYGSGWPIRPVSAPRDVELPRSIDYPISVNSTLTPRTGWGLMPFASLLEAYENVTECKMPVALIHRELTSFVPHLIDKNGNEVEDHPYAWMCETPDRKTPWVVWLTRFLKSAKVYDAPAVYLNEGPHGIDGLHFIDGSTLFVIVDQFGNIPEPDTIDEYVTRVASKGITKSSLTGVTGAITPITSLSGFIDAYSTRQQSGQSVPDKIPAYVQIIKGTPFSWWSADQVWYMPQSRRMNAPYGESFIEQAWSWIMLIVNLTAFELGHYRTGNMPEGFVTLPKDLYATPDQIMLAEQAYNMRMTENPATERNKLRMFPEGSTYTATKKPDFPAQLYRQAWNNILHTIGIPPSEFGEVPGGGLGGKGFKEGAASDLSRNTLDPHRIFVASLFNYVLERDGVDDIAMELAAPLSEADPDKQKLSMYEGMAHGTLSLNDARGQMNLSPVGDPEDPNNIANKHMIVAGSTIFVVEDMQIQNGMAVPSFAAQPGGNAGGAPVGPETVAEQAGAEHTPEDFKTLQEAMRHIQENGTLDGKTISIPKTVRPASTTVIQAGIAEEREEHPEVDTEMLEQLVEDHLEQDPAYYDKRADPSKCMDCGAKPTKDVLWANGMGRAWFCDKHFATWETAHKDDIVWVHDVKDGKVDLNKADVTHADGAMIAVMIPEEAAKQLRTITERVGFPESAQLELPESMHVTLAFLPDAIAAQKQRSLILDSMVSIATGMTVLQGKIQGFGVFNGQDGTKVLFALLDEPQLPFLRTALCEALDGIGVEYGKDYGFVPHVTLAYFPNSFELPAGFEVPDIPAVITSVTLAFGEELTNVPFSGSAAKLAKHCGAQDPEYYDKKTGVAKYEGQPRTDTGQWNFGRQPGQAPNVAPDKAPAQEKPAIRDFEQNMDRAQDYSDKWSKTIIKGLPEAVQNDIAHYADSSDNLNYALRNGRVPKDERDTRALTALDQALKQSTAPDDLIVYRGIDEKTALEFREGGVFRDKAFLSTSLNSKTPEGYGEVTVRIHVAKGSHVLPVGEVSPLPSESEVVLPRDSVFDIDNIKRNPQTGRTIIDVELRNE